MRSIERIQHGLVPLIVLGLWGCGAWNEPAPSADHGLGPREARSARLDAALEGLLFEDDRVIADPAAPIPRESGEALLREGLRLRSEGRLVEALAAFAGAVRAEPDNAETYACLGRLLRRKGRTEQALAAFRTAIDRVPGEPGYRYEAGKTLRLLNRPSDAAAALREALALKADHGPAHAQLAAVLYYEGQTDPALHHLARARELGAPASRVLESLLVTGSPPSLEIEPATGSASPVLGPPIRVDDGSFQAVETTVTAGPNGELVASWIQREVDLADEQWRIGAGVSLDGGTTWSASRLVPPEAENPGNFLADPVTARDPQSGTFLAAGVTFFGPRGLYFFRKAAGSLRFEEPTIHPGTNIDKVWMDFGALPGRPETSRLYVFHLRGMQTSDDLGTTLSPIQPLPGLGHLPRIGPGGELYVLFWDQQDGIFLGRSFDGGQSLLKPVRVATRMDFWGTTDTSRTPGGFRAPALPFLAVDSRDGTLYATWFDATRAVDGDTDLDVYLSHSTDRGTTWSPPRALELPGDQLAPWIEIDAEGRVHLLYFDTRRHPGTDDDETALVDVVHAVSLDRAESWQETRLTDEPIDTTFARWFFAGTPQFLGDYVSLDTLGDQAWAVYPALTQNNQRIFSRALDLSPLPSAPLESCTPGPEALCLVDGRFRVQVAWTDPRSGDTGLGRAVPFDFSDDSGTFWFFDETNVELVVKLLDAGPVNGRVWFFSGGLSDVEYTITITDTESGVTRAYRNVPGDICGQADTAAFPSTPSLRTGTAPGTTGESCVPTADTLCLTPDRFRVEVDWRDPRSGDTGRGFAIPGTSDSGFFWFFDEENVELVVKLLDGRPVNGNFWVFFGALTDVEYTITVTDTATGNQRRYENEAGNICGQADVAAF